MNEDEEKKFDEMLKRVSCPPLVFKTVEQDMRDRVLAFSEASDHAFYCRCEKCKEWWRAVGPEEDGTFGPFTSEEIRGNV